MALHAADDRSLAQVWKDAYEGKVRKSQALQLADAVQKHSTPVRSCSSVFTAGRRPGV